MHGADCGSYYRWVLPGCALAGESWPRGGIALLGSVSYRAPYLYQTPYLVYGLAVPGALSSAESGTGNVTNRHER
ncbi:hypothetical protein RM6536_1212 [Rothia mucilaginosa]|uniref:Uncharacterized protein n=1 Tax=Rothia mucilaginosa TaxID=43675 RepID=A0A0K2S066_9MICC|nr:hypothetical protein RM6536_1212 [Rothia mucilaginosa]